MKTALIIGATGLVGSHLLNLLLNDDRFGKIKVFTRRTTNLRNDKLDECLVDFDKPDEWKSLLSGDILFSTLGTTIKKAGSKDEQFKIDFTYQYRAAESASQNGTGIYVLVSSAGADPGSGIFYSRMKGELEEAVKKLPFRQLVILRPGILDGERKESRPLEKFSISIARGLGYLPGVKKYRPIHAEIVAKAMINGALKDNSKIIAYTLEQVFELASE